MEANTPEAPLGPEAATILEVPDAASPEAPEAPGPDDARIPDAPEAPGISSVSEIHSTLLPSEKSVLV